MGFFGVALATTLSGDVTFALSDGLATLSGKSFDPFFQGAVLSSSAGGAGIVGSADGDHVIGSGGMEGKFGWGGAGGLLGFEFEEEIPQAHEYTIAAAIIAVNRI